MHDQPVYQEAYYTDETFIMCVDGAGCLTPELVYVAPVAGDWEYVGYDAPASSELFDPWIGVAD